MKNIKRYLVLLLSIIIVFSLMACKNEKPKEETKKVTKVENQTEEHEELPEVTTPSNQNPLTGLPDLSEGAIGKRPVAVMINNHEAALPQYGIAQADIMYEIPVEGDISRMMAIYGDYTTVPKICPVRSCRAYFPSFALGYDAFYVHWGSDDTIWDYLLSLNLDMYDGMSNAGGLFGRDENRLAAGYSLEHTGYFDGTGFASLVASEGKRTDLSEALQGKTAFQFYGLDEQVKPQGQDCRQIHINFGATTTDFSYDEASKTYLKSVYGTPQMDGNTNTQLAYTNVFILETEISVRDEEGHKDVNWRGGKDHVGYYISNGAVQKIHWEKAQDERSQLKFYDESGKEIQVNRGKSYIAVNYAGQSTFS